MISPTGNTHAPNASEGLALKPQKIHASQSLAATTAAPQALLKKKKKNKKDTKP